MIATDTELLECQSNDLFVDRLHDVLVGFGRETVEPSTT
jgi:hypothetical protein